jgi:wyosine [tRNA(Phe)-imidazoG37] synthetase (radical SAM superfamily)
MSKKDIKPTIDFLNSVSPTFCMAKWMKPVLSLNSGIVAACCLSKDEPIDPKGIEDEPWRLVNPPNFYNQRKDLLEGRAPKSCYYCEYTNAFYNSDPSERIFKSQDSMSDEEKQRVLAAGAEKPIVPSYLEVSFSNKCNLKCIYCEASSSSSIMDEAKKYGPFAILSSSNSEYESRRRGLRFFDDDKNPYKDAFWKWFPKVSQQIYTFRVTGGEPLLCEDTYRVMDFYAETKHPNTEFIVNTNLMIGEDYLKKFCEKLERLDVKKVSLITSVDTFDQDAEFIRNGFDWQIFLRNLKSMMKQFPKIDISITATFSIFSLFSFSKFLDTFDELKELRPENPISLNTYPLFGPAHLSIRYLGDEFRHYVKEIKERIKISKLTEYEKKLLEITLAEYGKDCELDWLVQANKSQFYWHIEQLQERRNFDFITTFPHLKEYYKGCEDDGLELLKLYLNKPEKQSTDYLKARLNFLEVLKALPKQLIEFLEDKLPPSLTAEKYILNEMKESKLKLMGKG